MQEREELEAAAEVKRVEEEERKAQLEKEEAENKAAEIAIA